MLQLKLARYLVHLETIHGLDLAEDCCCLAVKVTDLQTKEADPNFLVGGLVEDWTGPREKNAGQASASAAMSPAVNCLALATARGTLVLPHVAIRNSSSEAFVFAS